MFDMVLNISLRSCKSEIAAESKNLVLEQWNYRTKLTKNGTLYLKVYIKEYPTIIDQYQTLSILHNKEKQTAE